MSVGYRKQVEAAMPGTKEQICAKSGMTPGTVMSWIRIMRKELVCHITSWRRTVGKGGRFKAVYALGAGVDAECRLKPASVAKNCQRYRDKVSRDAHTADVRRAKDRARYWEKKARKQGDATVNLLFGRT